MKEQSLLVIEDNIEDFHAVVRTFNKCGFSSPIYHCESGEEVIDYFSKSGKFQGSDKKLPELILLDLNLPGMDGKDILVKIREDIFYKKIPVVILTTSKNEHDIYECYKRGANSYIEKPVDIEKFIETIKRIKEYWFEINLISA